MTSSLIETLLRLGFRNGVFHLEARIKDSRMNYSMTEKGTELVDSQPRVGKSQDPSVFLIEINARLPGHQESFAVEYTYGIDYFALHMLMALSSGTSATQSTDNTALKSIIRALSQPLSATVQYPTNIVFTPAERGGTFVAAKPLPESLMSYVPQFTMFMQEGEVMNDPDVEGKWPFVAYFLVVTKLKGTAGRDQVRKIVEMVRESFEYEMR